MSKWKRNCLCSCGCRQKRDLSYDKCEDCRYNYHMSDRYNRTQDHIARMFVEGARRGRSYSGNLCIEDDILRHYNTIEAFRDKNGKIIANRNCYSKGFAHCPNVESDASVSINAINFLLKCHVDFCPSKFELIEGSYDCAEFEYEGKRYFEQDHVLRFKSGKPICHCYSGDNMAMSWKDWQKHLRRKEGARRAVVTKRERYLKEIVPIGFLEKLGFGFTYVHSWHVEADERTHVFSIDEKLKPIVCGLYERPDCEGVYVFKLAFLQGEEILSVWICGRDEIGQLWQFELPVMTYGLASLEACQRAVLGMSKGDILVEQS